MDYGEGIVPYQNYWRMYWLVEFRKYYSFIGCVGRVAGLVVVLCTATASYFAQVPAKDGENGTIVIKTSLVLIPVTVKSRRGATISGLTKERFKVFEDGVEQEVTHFETPDKPLMVALVLDQSDSTKISVKDILSAALLLLDQLLPHDKAMVVAFDRNVNKLTQVTGDRETLSMAVSIIKSGGGTSLYDAVETTVTSYLEGVAGRKTLILLTDGIDTSSSKATYESSTAIVAAANVAVYPIQYPSEDLNSKRLSSENSHLGSPIYTTPSGESISSAHQRGTRYLRQIAASSGGRFHYADSPTGLRQAFEQILAELRQQYYIGYYPKRQSEKKEKRRIKVLVNAPDTHVENRENFVLTP
jgi:Ca-activated chloride channel family protein